MPASLGVTIPNLETDPRDAAPGGGLALPLAASRIIRKETSVRVRGGGLQAAVLRAKRLEVKDFGLETKATSCRAHQVQKILRREEIDRVVGPETLKSFTSRTCKRNF